MEILTVPIDSIEILVQYRTDPNEERLEELAKSIEEVGLLEPPVVRRSGSKYELIAGWRRILACKRNGNTEIPVHVMEIDNVVDVQLTENLHREDPHPLDEADVFELLLERLGSISAVAKRSSKAKRYVLERLRLSALSPRAREAFRLSKIDLHTAYLLARYDRDSQEQTMAEVSKRSGDGGEIEDWAIGQILRKLSRSLDSARFPTNEPVGEIVSCLSCPKNSTNQFSLFETEEGGQCLDAGCWDKKVDIWWAAFKKDAKKTGIRVLSKSEVKGLYRPKSEGGYLGYDSEMQELHPKEEQIMVECEAFDPVKVAWAQSPIGEIHRLYPRKELQKALRVKKPRTPTTPEVKLEKVRHRVLHRMKDEVLKKVREESIDLRTRALLTLLWSLGEKPVVFFGELDEDTDISELIKSFDEVKKLNLALDISALLLFRSNSERLIEDLGLAERFEELVSEGMKTKRKARSK